MERPDFKFHVKPEKRIVYVPTERFLSAEYEYGDISADLADMKDFHIEIEKQVYEELSLENPNNIKSICESPIIPQTPPNTPKAPRKVTKFSDSDKETL